MSKVNSFLLKVFNKIFNCSRLWLVNISPKKPFTVTEINGYTFYVITSNRELEQRKHDLAQERGEDYIEIINKRIENGSYWCYLFIHDDTKQVAYTRWTCYNFFYSDPLKKELKFEDNEIFTLNSFTHPDHRMKGLHREVNIRMLNYLMFNTNYTRVYMIINCFLKHLTRIPLELGYKPVYTKLQFKKRL